MHSVCIYSPGVQSPKRRDYQLYDMLVTKRGWLQPYAVRLTAKWFRDNRVSNRCNDERTKADCVFGCGRVFHEGCYAAKNALADRNHCAVCGFRPA